MNKQKKGKIFSPFVIIFFILFMVYVLSMFFILGWGLLTSLKNPMDFSMYDPLGGKNVLGFPNISLDAPEFLSSRDYLFKLKNYTDLFGMFEVDTLGRGSYYSRGKLILMPREVFSFWDMLLNTVIFCFNSAFFKVAALTITAYCCAKYKFFLSKIVYGFVVVAMTIPIIGTAPAELNMYRDLGIYSTWMQNIMQSFSFTGMYFLVVHAFFESMSNTYIEAAEIDGASQLTIFLRIAVPLAKNVIFSIFIITFITAWNGYETVLLYFPTKPTLAYGVFDTSRKSQSGASSVPFKCASCFVLALPIIVLFSIFHKRIMGNVSMGGIKE